MEPDPLLSAGNAATSRIILAAVPEDTAGATALFLSGCFSLPPSSTRGIVASAPVVLLSGLSPAQAEAVLAELRPFLPAGVTLRAAGGEEEEQASRLQWPSPPRIYGRDLADFAPAPAESDLRCPVCGELIHVRVEGGRLRATAPRGRPKRSTTRHFKPPAAPRDPLFSGVKPLDTADSGRVARTALQAGDTGFWLNHGELPDPPPGPDRPGETTSARRLAAKGAATPAAPAGDSTSARRAAAKGSGSGGEGLASFMKPGVFAVVVGRTRDPQAVKMIAEIMGLPEADAGIRCTALGLCVARDIALDEAQNLAARFRGLGGKARIVKPM